MDSFDAQRKAERRTLIVAGMLVVACLGVFAFYDDIVDRMTGSQNPAVGSIESVSRDVRFKDSSQFDWNQARREQTVRLGDAVYAGDASKAVVKLGANQEITIDERSMVKFAKIDGINMANLEPGTFHIKLDGNAKIAINGQAVELQGHGAEVQVVMSQSREAKLKVVKGSVQYKAVKKGVSRAVVLKQNEEVLAETAQKAPASVEEPAPIVEQKPVELPKPAIPQNLQANGGPYIWRLYDFYQRDGGKLSMREKPVDSVNSPHTVAWRYSGGPAGDYIVQQDRDPRFSSPMEFRTTESKFALARSFLGDNYWRVKTADGVAFTEPAHFELIPDYLPDRVTFERPAETADMHSLRQAFTLRWHSPPTLSNFVIEHSNDPAFSQTSTEVVWVAGTEASMVFTRPGIHYFRVRGVNVLQQLSMLSEVHKVRVTLPTRLKAPATKSLIFLTGIPKPGSLKWSSQDEAQNYVVDIYDSRNNKLGSKTVSENDFPLRPMHAGNYSYQVTPIDQFGRAGSKSEITPFKFVNPPPKAVAKREDKKKEERKPAQAEERAKVQPESPYPNDGFRDDMLSFEGALSTMTSSQQVDDQKGVPAMGEFGVDYRRWWGAYGFDGSIRQQVLKFTSNDGQGSYTDVEIRGLRRWTTDWNWFSWLRKLQISFVGGLEFWKNTGAQSFSPGYNIAKAGINLEFPTGSRWDMGGDILGGFGLDSTWKAEIAGHVDYWMTKQYSLGVGYRVFFLGAGSTASAPGQLPYDEAYGETYTALRYKF